ncbi:MAG TPA: hypothetical protein VMX15_06525 [Candidatus Heimdallarchaeota archaeon]|nr:hypothetical protein [Candidatus Heimdallarchaeota archaeon]
MREEQADAQYESHFNELYGVAFAQFSSVMGRPQAAAKAEAEASMGAFRIMCRTNLWFFAREVFGMPEARRGGRKLWHEHFQGSALDALESDEDALIWESRHMLKTTCAEIWATQRVIDDPVNVAVSWGSATAGKARKSLKTITKMLLHKKLLLAFADRIIANPNKWDANNQDFFTITRNVPDEDGHMREIPPDDPQVRVFSMESGITGDHPTHILLDDFVNEKNTTTVVQINKALDRFSAVAGTRGIDTVTKIIGTPWHPLDLYHHIIENNIIPEKNRVNIRGVHLEGTKEVIDYPWYTHEFLSKQKAQMRHLYWPQFHLDTRPREDKMFIPPYPMWGELPKEVEYYIGVDPSLGLSVNHDKTGIAVAAVDKQNTTALYLVEAESYTLEDVALAEKLLDLIGIYKPVRIGIELGLQRALLSILRMKAQEKFQRVGVAMPDIWEIPTGGGQNASAKWQKIKGTVATMLADHRLLLGQGMTSLRMEMELYDLHKQKNEDDILDACRILIQTVPYFTYGHFTVENRPVAQKLTWKALVESLNSGKSDRERMFAN